MKISSSPAKHSVSSFHDGEAISRLEAILYSHGLVKPDLKKDDTWPNYDGYLEVVDANGYPKGTLKAQVKTLRARGKNGKISYSFKDEKFLAFCNETRENPILFIGVDRANNVAYWQEMTPQYIKDIDKKTIYLIKENIIAQDNRGYYEPWLKICEKRKRAIRDYTERRKPQRRTQKKEIPSHTIERAKQKLQSLFIDQNLKYKYYYPFIDLLEPFYLDKNGQEPRRKLRKIFNITEKEENKFMKKMLDENLIKIVGDLCIIQDQQKAKELQNEMINRDTINIETILNIFF